MSEPRYFVNVEGFKDDTAYVRVDGDGRCYGVPKDAKEWLYTAASLSTCVEKVQRGIWRELTDVEVRELLAGTPHQEEKAPK